MNKNCLVCETLAGKRKTPGGVIYENEYWLVDHILPPVFVLGCLIIKLKRHCEHLAELTVDEAEALGPLLQRVSETLQKLLSAEKVHVASYGEGIKHIHFIVTPRTADLPASNIRLIHWLLWRRFWYRLGWKRIAYDQAQAFEVAAQIRSALLAYTDA
jgi:diadenosine tetraphosphate (Ap4A) HIT family hydrolase